MRPSMRTRQKALTRQLLWDSAIALFTEKGYAATTIDEITSAAGVSRATFYLHFDNKAQIVAYIYDDVVMLESIEFYRRLDAITTAAQLRNWLDDALDFYERHHDLLSCGDEAVSLEPALQDYTLARVLDRCVEEMPRYRGRWSEPERDKSRLRLELLALQITYFARLWVNGRWPVERETVLDVLLDLWGHVMLPAPSSG